MVKTVVCPRCGFKFALSYARVTACRGCPISALSCEYVRCPRCGHEFTIEEAMREGTSLFKKI